MARTKHLSVGTFLKWWQKIDDLVRHTGKKPEQPAKPPTPPIPAQPANHDIDVPVIPQAEGLGPALMGKSMVIKGQIQSRQDLCIDGEVEGTLEIPEHSITVGVDGNLRCDIKARDVLIAGTVHGNIDATGKIEIRKSARLVGDIRTACILIEDGAYFKGFVDIFRPEVSRSAESPQSDNATCAKTATLGE